MAESSERLWGSQEVGATTRRRVQWDMNQAEDGSSNSGGDILPQVNSGANAAPKNN